jgi:hypothetical protein
MKYCQSSFYKAQVINEFLEMDFAHFPDQPFWLY